MKLNKFRTIFLASMIALSLHSLTVKADPVITRLGGLDRYGTAITVSQKGWTSSQYVILANGLNYPDALGAAALSKQYDAPVLLTYPESLTSETSNEIARLGAKHVLILGGIGVVSSNIEQGLIKNGFSVTRLCGEDRYSTSVAIANQLDDPSEVILANGDNFPDALAISPVAGIKGIPILLVSTNYASPSVLEYIKAHGITKTYIIGGQAVISDDVANNFAGVERIYGNDRYETDIAIINRFKDLFNTTQFLTSSGEDFPDSLSGVPLAVKTSSPIVLLNKAGNMAMRAMLKNTTLVNNIVLGGEGATPTSRVNELFTDPTQIPVVRDLNSLVYGSPVIATVNYATSGLSAGQRVEVLLDHGNGTSYMVYNANADKYPTVSASALSIPHDPVADKNLLSNSEIALYANSHSFTSNTKYYVWVDIARQQVYVLSGGAGNWSVSRTFPCASGHNVTPSLRGLFTLGTKQYAVSGGGETGYYGRQFTGNENCANYYIHSIPTYSNGEYDYTLGARASHGCIRVSVDNAIWIYNGIPSGTSLWVN